MERKPYKFSPGSMGLASALLQLLSADQVDCGIWPGPCYALVSPDELEALRDIFKSHNISISEVK